jgi:hypothetical protein
LKLKFECFFFNMGIIIQIINGTGVCDGKQATSQDPPAAWKILQNRP